MSDQQNELRVETVSIDSITPDPANVRTHDDRNLEAIRSSLERFGQMKPIVVDADGIVRAGNGTLEAARQLGWQTITIAWSSLRGAEAAAYAIADNRTNDLSDFDEDALRQVITTLQDTDGIEPDAIGFDESALAELMPDEMTPQFEPVDPVDNTKLDQKAGQTVTCPHCGGQFEA